PSVSSPKAFGVKNFGCGCAALGNPRLDSVFPREKHVPPREELSAWFPAAAPRARPGLPTLLGRKHYQGRINVPGYNQGLGTGFSDESCEKAPDTVQCEHMHHSSFYKIMAFCRDVLESVRH